MDDLETVNVLYAAEQLLEKATCFLFFDPSALDNVVEELSPVCIFHDEVELLLSLDNFVKLNDAGVSHDLQNVNLSSDTLHIGYI